MGNLTIKVSKSPCSRCTQTIITLKKDNPELSIRVKVLGLYTGEMPQIGEGGVLKLRSAGIPVRLWDVRSAYESEDIATHGQKGRELKEFTEMKSSSFDQIEGREVRRYDVAWSGKKEYRDAFSGSTLSEKARTQILLDQLNYQNEQAASALRGYLLRTAELQKFIQQIDKVMLAPKDMTERFVIDSDKDSHVVTRQKQGYNAYRDEHDKLAQLILNVQAEKKRIDTEMEKLKGT